MKIFLLYFFKILAGIVIIAAVLQCVADKGLKGIEGSIFQDWEQILNGNINSEILISGSSRGVVSYDPEIISRHTGLTSFNISFDGGPYNLQRVKNHLYLKNNELPVVFIQNIDIAHCSELLSIPLPFQFLPFLRNDDLRNELKKIDPEFGEFCNIPLLKYNGNISLFQKGILTTVGKNYIIAPTQDGFVPIDKEYRPDYNNLKRIHRKDSLHIDFENYRKGIKSTFKFLEDTFPSNTIIFLVWAPEYKIRLELSNELRESIKKEIIAFVEENENIYFLDYSSHPISLDSSNFYDSFHLNQKGANLFSEKVAKEVALILNR